MENRHGLVVDAELTRASGHAERLAALAMLDRLPTTGPATLGADLGFDAKDCIPEQQLDARDLTGVGMTYFLFSSPIDWSTISSLALPEKLTAHSISARCEYA
jgi:hypothetical protein